jgi:hypothetical protein
MRFLTFRSVRPAGQSATNDERGSGRSDCADDEVLDMLAAGNGLEGASHSEPERDKRNNKNERS